MPRRTISHSKKALTVLLGLQGKTTIAEYCATKGIARSSFYRWRAEVLTVLAMLMEDKTKQSRQSNKHKN